LQTIKEVKLLKQMPVTYATKNIAYRTSNHHKGSLWDSQTERNTANAVCRRIRGDMRIFTLQTSHNSVWVKVSKNWTPDVPPDGGCVITKRTSKDRATALKMQKWINWVAQGGNSRDNQTIRLLLLKYSHSDMTLYWVKD
jgi:hypothetical protein